MTPEQLAETILKALTTLVDDGTITVDGGLPGELKVERPKNPEHGDYATNVAMQLGKRAGMPPRQFAELLADRLSDDPAIAAVEVAGPGFINIRVAADAQGQVASAILEAGAAYGAGDSLKGRKINLEFVSANPTGPIHLGGTRWAAAGDSLARIFAAQGADVTREYYFNDHGAQIDRFARSLLAAARGAEPPEDGYAGGYITEIAADVVAKAPDVVSLADAEAQEVFRREGVELMFAQIKAELHAFGVDFDVYFHENTLHESGAVERAIARLTEMGNTYESGGALWLRTEKYGDDKDRVIIKSDGEAAYISGDLAYYLDKRERGFDLAVIMLGA
ncbi:MAG TPA: arginine--tRNA ligase, partial [Kribbella sp.]